MAGITGNRQNKSLKLKQNSHRQVRIDSLNPSGPTSLNAVFDSENRNILNLPKSVAVSVAPYPYKLARLIHHNYNLKKRWYVLFYAWDVSKEKLCRVRMFEPINRKKTVKDRMDIARDVIYAVNTDLMAGKCLGKEIIEPTAHNLRTLTINQALDYIEQQKKLNRLRKGSLKRYRTFKMLFDKYFEFNNLEPYLLKSFTPDVMADFFHWLQTERKIANKTFNNYRGDLNTFFRWCMKKDARLMKVNPMDGIDKLKTVATKHAAFSDDQLTKIKAKALAMGYDHLVLFIQFIYYTLARPIEIREFRVKYIDLAANRIYIPGSISKNGMDEYVPMAPDLRKAIIESGVLDCPGDYRIFGYAGRPGTEPCGIDLFYEKNSKVLKALNLTTRAYSLYSYKHSGVVALYRLTKDIKLVQRICRHQTLEQTNIYLRDLGLLTDYEILNFWKGSI